MVERKIEKKIVTTSAEVGSPACSGGAQRPTSRHQSLFRLSVCFVLLVSPVFLLFGLMSFPIFSRWTRPCFVQDCLYVTFVRFRGGYIFWTWHPVFFGLSRCMSAPCIVGLIILFSRSEEHFSPVELSAPDSFTHLVPRDTSTSSSEEPPVRSVYMNLIWSDISANLPQQVLHNWFFRVMLMIETFTSP